MLRLTSKITNWILKDEQLFLTSTHPNVIEPMWLGAANAFGAAGDYVGGARKAKLGESCKSARGRL